MSTGTQTSAKAKTIRINLEGGAQAEHHTLQMFTGVYHSVLN